MKRAESGFTLLELLVSITIFALLMVVLTGALQLGSRQVKRLTGQVDRTTDVALAQNFLRTHLGAAQPLVASSGDSKVIQFDGEPNGIEFVATAPESVRLGGLQVLTVAYRQAKGGADGQLVVGWRPLREGPDAPAASPPPTVLLDHVRAAKFVYYGPPTPKDAADWQTDWKRMTYLPLLVRVSVTFANGDAMPDLTVALRLSSSEADLRLNQNRRF